MTKTAEHKERPSGKPAETPVHRRPLFEDSAFELFETLPLGEHHPNRFGEVCGEQDDDMDFGDHEGSGD